MRTSSLSTDWRRESARSAAMTTAMAVVAWSAGTRVITGDHFQYLLPVIRSADPQFAEGDWFADETTAYHYTFQAALSIAERAGVTIPALGALHLVILLALCLAVHRLSRALEAGLAGTLLALVAIRFGVQRTWGDVNLMGATALPHYAGLALALTSIALWFSGRHRPAIAGVVATAYVHVSVGAWLIATMLAMALVESLLEKRDLRPLLGAAGLGFVALIPLGLLAASGFAGADVDPRVFDILFRLRAPHHYAFESFGSANHREMVVVVAVGLIAEHRLRPDNRSLRTAIVVIAFLGLVGGFFLHVVYWPLPVRLFPFRVTPLVVGLAAVTSSALIARASSSTVDRLLGSCGLALLLLVETPSTVVDAVTAFGRASSALLFPVTVVVVLTLRGVEKRWFARRAGNDTSIEPLVWWFVAVGLVAFAVAATSSDLVREPMPSLFTASAVIAGLVAAGLLLGRSSSQDGSDGDPPRPPAALAAIPLVCVLVAWSPPVHTTSWMSDDQQAFSDLVVDVVPQGETMLIPPNQTHLRFGTGRAVVVDFKAFPIAGPEMVQWRERLEAVSGKAIEDTQIGGTDLRRQVTNDYHARSAAELVATARGFGARYVVVSGQSPIAAEFIDSPSGRSWSEGGFVLFEIGE